MVEKQLINGKEVWIRIDPHPIERKNPNIIPTEYFTATYYFGDAGTTYTNGELIKEDDGSAKLFESPVAAITYASKFIENINGSFLNEIAQTEQTQQEQKETD